MSFIQEIKAAIDESEKRGSLLALEAVAGLSGSKLIGLLQRCAAVVEKKDDVCYLEVGVFQGLTLTSVTAATPGLKCFGIDDFSQFDADGENRNIVEQRLATHTSGNGQLINADFENALLGLKQHIADRRIAVYFVDGPHDYRSQYLCLDFAQRYLSRTAVIIVDDSNYEHVRRANRDWLKANSDFALLFEAYTPCHPRNMSANQLAQAKAGWWNGVNVIVSDSEHELERIYPPVSESRERYFNDHNIHPAEQAELAPRLLNAIAYPLPLSVLKLAKLFLQKSRKQKFRNMNTASDQLDTPRLAKRMGK